MFVIKLIDSSSSLRLVQAWIDGFGFEFTRKESEAKMFVSEEDALNVLKQRSLLYPKSSDKFVISKDSQTQSWETLTELVEHGILEL